MKRLLVAFAAAFSLCTSAFGADLSGTWTFSWEPDFGGNFDAYDCTFKQDGRRLTIDCRGDAMSGEVDQRSVIIRFKTGRDGSLIATLSGELNQEETTITGTWHLPAPVNREGKFTARKQ